MSDKRELVLHIDGMSCQACATRIEKVLNKKDFVASASVSFASETATVQLDDANRLDDVLAAVAQAGFAARLRVDDAAKTAEPMPYRLWAMLIVCAPFAWGMVAMMFGRHDAMLSAQWQWALASVVQWGLMWPFYLGAWAALRGGAANMDVLVSLGTLAAYGLSAVNVWHDADTHQVYFEAAVMVATFVSLGKYGETRLKRGGLNGVAALMRLTPATVVRQKGAAWETVNLADVVLGDVLRVGDGERVAADGVVLDGTAWVDEQHLTGEGRLLSRGAGDAVVAGALVSGGVLVYRAKALGADTLLGDMMAALAQAQSSKAPIARLADRVSAVFVPLVMVVAVLTFVWVFAASGSLDAAWVRAVAVLVIACPCALGLAAPAAIMAGIGVAARCGVRFKDAAAVEAAAGANVLVFDKTGTLTRGQAQVIDVWLPEGVAETRLWSAAALAQYSAHPLSQAVYRSALARETVLPDVVDVVAEAGAGVRGQCWDWGGQLRLGKADFCGIRLPEAVLAAHPHASWVAVSLNGQALGAWALADALHEDAPAALADLAQMGVRVAVLSGDRQGAVDAAVQALPNAAFCLARGNCSARDKAAVVQQWQAAGLRVAMVGDGVNDAAALAAADAGLAMGRGMQVAEQAASAVLMQNNPRQAVWALQVARVTLNNIKQNLFFSFVYNVLGIPLAALGYLTPTLAGAAMALSSLSVLLNAWRLTRFQAT